VTDVSVLVPACDEQLQVEPAAAPEPTADASPPTWSGRDIGMVIAAGLTLFGVVVVAFVVYLGGITRLEHARAQRTLVSDFDKSLENKNAPVGGRVDEGTAIAMVSIPALDVREVIVEGTSGTQLKKGPGHLRVSPFPGQQGNVVIAGRRFTYGGVFMHLDRLKRGDEIRFVTGQGTSVYRVVEGRTIERGHNDVIQPTSDNRVTLITSEPVLAGERYALIAELKGSPLASPGGWPTELRQSELGLNTDGGNVVALILWLQLLLVGSLATVWLLRKYSKPSVYVVMTPVLLLLALLVFDSATALLPSTL
jgi:LPXTG-site transpeptidase (sortase) family protein